MVFSNRTGLKSVVTVTGDTFPTVKKKKTQIEMWCYSLYVRLLETK